MVGDYLCEGPHHGPIVVLLALPVQAGAFLAQRFPTGAGTQIFALDVIASRAFTVVVMHLLLDRVPGIFPRHDSSFHAQSMDQQSIRDPPQPVHEGGRTPTMSREAATMR